MKTGKYFAVKKPSYVFENSLHTSYVNENNFGIASMLNRSINFVTIFFTLQSGYTLNLKSTSKFQVSSISGLSWQKKTNSYVCFSGEYISVCFRFYLTLIQQNFRKQQEKKILVVPNFFLRLTSKIVYTYIEIRLFFYI